MNYKELHSSESHGVYGGFGIKILVSTSHEVDLSLLAIQNAAYDAAKKIYAEVMASAISTNKEIQVGAEKERRNLLGVFAEPIFSKPIPNEYCSDWCCRHLPWFLVTTKVGEFKIGRRKRVIHLEWTNTVGTKTATELFIDEETTKGHRMIHAWSYDKAREYVAKIIEAAN